MALINCPECGRQVSDVATSCPTCGYPIAKNNPKGNVIIRMDLAGYALNIVVFEAQSKKELWRGKTGNTAIIPVDGPTEIEIKGRNMGRTSATVKAGERYEFTSEPGWVSQRDVLRLVDVIDSGR